MKILVVGGTRYFGIPMVNALLANGHDVTIATRGNVKVDFNGNVDYVILDRTDAVSVKKALDNRKFDVIIDKIAYSSDDVKALLENVSCDRYIQMSTCSVYPEEHADITEDEFVTAEYPLEWMGRIPDYARTKRNAERAVLEYMESSAFTFVRYPIDNKLREKKLGKKAILDENGDAAPFNGLTDTLSFSTEIATKAGYNFSTLDSWLYKLIDHEIGIVDGK